MAKFFVGLSIFFISMPLFAQMIPLSTQVGKTEMNFYLYTPVQDQDTFPMVVFLHGGGESGKEIEKVKTHGLPKLISEGRDFPFYVFAPQNPYEKGLWDDRVVDEMVGQLLDTLNIDPDRLYLVGLSRGGYGVWRMAINHPDKYAAMISICPASIPLLYTGRISDLPIWLFHGEQDPVVPVEVSKEVYEKMLPQNAQIKITLYPEAKHDSWTQTFENDEVYKWLLMQKRSSP